MRPAVRKTGMTPAVLTDHEDKVAFDFFQAKLQAKSMASIDRELATKETELLKGKKVGYVFIDAKTLLESVKSGNVTNAAQFFQIHAPRTLRTTEILLDEQGVAVSFRAPMAVQDETGKSMLEKKSPNKPDFPAHATRRPVSARRTGLSSTSSLPRDSYFASAAFSRLAWRARSTSITSASSRSASARSTSR